MFTLYNRYGEIVNINLVRDKKTGKPKGFCFLAYEEQRSTVLAVDNLNGFKVKCVLTYIYIFIIIIEYNKWPRQYIVIGGYLCT